MDNGTLVAANHHIEGRRPGVRRASVLVALAMFVALFVMVQKPAEAAPRGAPVGVSAQIDFRPIVCPILLELRATYASSPFFASVVPIIDAFLVQFGCVPGTTTTTVAPTTTTTTRPPTTTTTLVLPPGFPPVGASCATLLAIRNSFIGGPFAVFIPFVDIALASLGCVVSG